MTLLRAKVTSKGQVTLPKSLRDTLDINEGDQIEFAVDASQHVSIVKLRAAGSSAGILKHLANNKPVTVEEMNEAIEKTITKKFNQS